MLNLELAELTRTTPIFQCEQSYYSWILRNIYTGGENLERKRILNNVKRNQSIKRIFSAYTFKSLSYCGMRMRLVIMSRLENWRMVLKKKFRPPTRPVKGTVPTSLLLLSFLGLIDGLLLTAHLVP